MPLEKQFEIILEAFLNRKRVNDTSENSIRALRCQYRREFREMDKIPPALLGEETRGCKTTLLPEIQQRFAELVKASKDETSPYFCPVKERTLTYLQSILESEFEQSINYHSLYSFSKSKAFKKMLNSSVKAGV